MNKPMLIIPVTNTFGLSRLNLDVQYKFDMENINKYLKEDPNWFENNHWLEKNLNIICTTDVDQWDGYNLPKYSDIVLRKDGEFLSMSKLISEHIVKSDIDSVIENYMNLEFEKESDYLLDDEKRYMIYEELFPTLKKDLQPIYQMLKRYEHLRWTDLEISKIETMSGACIVTVRQEDHDDSSSDFKFMIMININTDSSYLGWFTIPDILDDIVSNLMYIYDRLPETRGEING